MTRSHRFNYKGVKGTVIYPELLSPEEALKRLTAKFGKGVRLL